MKILLVQPAPYEHGRVGLENALWLSEPAALTSLAAMVEPDHEVRILDLRLEAGDRLPRVLADFRPDLVGITAMTTDAYQAQAVAYCAKAILGPAVFTLVGGHHPTLDPEAHDVDCLDAVCIGEGEETFAELVAHLAAGGERGEGLASIDGLAFRGARGFRQTARRSQARALDSFPAPARHLIEDYRSRYFFGPAAGMASIQTSRGCAFDCSFCAIWEFYERKVRFLSAEAIVDRMEAVPERFIMFLDDNFLSHRGRLEAFLDELERRGLRKYWMIQGRTDFIAANPDLMRRMRDNGLAMVLSGYETNDDEALAAIRKETNRDQNQAAARILRRLGVLTTGIFMTRPDFEESDFEELYDAINDLAVTIPLVVIHMPLPGTQDWRRDRASLLTEDARLFDLLHAVVPTRLDRRRFYELYAGWNRATVPSVRRSLRSPRLLLRPGLLAALARGWPRFRSRLEVLRTAIEDHEGYLRDEYEIVGAPPAPPREEKPKTRELVA